MEWYFSFLMLFTVVQCSGLSAQADLDCTQYQVQTEDTCNSIGKKAGVTYAQLLSWNAGINSQCSNLGNFRNSSICVSNPQGSYKIPTNSQGAASIITTVAQAPTPTADDTNSRCGRYYLVASGDDCSTIATKFGVTKDEFLFLNPDISDDCTNLLKDVYYCVKPVGYISSYPGYGAGSTKTTEPFVQTPSTPLPGIGSETNYTTGGNPVIPLAENTRRDCYSYFWTANLTENDIANCWGLAMTYEITDEELILWNPSLAKNESESSPDTTNSPSVSVGNPYTWPCTVSESSSYCVWLTSPVPTPTETISTPSPRATDEIANCTNWGSLLGEYGTCRNFLRNYDLSLAEFYAMNPTIKSDCSGYKRGTWYCISTYPSGAPAGQPGWKPASSSFPVTPTGSSTPIITPTSGSTVTTPSPVQTGMVSNCDGFYKVAVDDSCVDIAKSHHISLEQFYSWNPAVKDDCSGLQAKTYVCVDVSTTTTLSSPTPARG